MLIISLPFWILPHYAWFSSDVPIQDGLKNEKLTMHLSGMFTEIWGCKRILQWGKEKFTIVCKTGSCGIYKNGLTSMPF